MHRDFVRYCMVDSCYRLLGYSSGIQGQRVKGLSSLQALHTRASFEHMVYVSQCSHPRRAALGQAPRQESGDSGSPCQLTQPPSLFAMSQTASEAVPGAGVVEWQGGCRLARARRPHFRFPQERRNAPGPRVQEASASVAERNALRTGKGSSSWVAAI